jgi:hypothetical protein
MLFRWGIAGHPILRQPIAMAYNGIVKPSVPQTLKSSAAVTSIYAAMTIALLSAVATAQQSDPYHACAAEKDSTARLACFDGVDSARHPTSSAPSNAPAVSNAPAAAPPPGRPADPDIGLDARQARLERAQRGEPEPAPAQSAVIVATVVTVIPRTPLISAFELSNGQIWEQAESMRFSAEPQQTVTIRPGLLGAFFLKNAAGDSVRVHRVK